MERVHACKWCGRLEGPGGEDMNGRGDEKGTSLNIAIAAMARLEEKHGLLMQTAKGTHGRTGRGGLARKGQRWNTYL